MSDPLLTPIEVCARYGLAYQTLNNWRRLGRGPRFVKLPGGRGLVRYRLSDLIEWEEMSFRHGGGADAKAA